MPAGRPTKYRPEFVQELIDFYSVEPYEDIDIPHYKKGELVWTDKKRMPTKLPTLVQFAKHLTKKYKKIGIRTVYDWIDPKHSSYQEEFSHAYTRVAKPLQKDFLIQNGLQGFNNPLYAKFIAINLTDMRDKIENTHTGPEGGPIETIVHVIVDPKEKK